MVVWCSFLYRLRVIDSGLAETDFMGEVLTTRRCRGVTYPESYITKCTTDTKIKLEPPPGSRRLTPDETSEFMISEVPQNKLMYIPTPKPLNSKPLNPED